jgi:[NiFe] hydrogenase diaphorase moiety large subunit
VVGAGRHVGPPAGALLAALDGHRGEPATTPRADARSQSAAIANPADFCHLATLCAQQGGWPADIDAALAALPSLLAVSGDCARPGLYEFPADVTIAEILGAAGAGKARAVQVGGIAAPFTLADAFARPLTAAERAGDGTFIVYGPQRNLLREARGIMALFQERSCGQCTPCRNGLAVLLANADSLLRGERPAQSNREIISLGETVHLASKCPLGQAAPVAFLSVMERIAAHR